MLDNTDPPASPCNLFFVGLLASLNKSRILPLFNFPSIPNRAINEDEKLQLAACRTPHYPMISMKSQIKFKLSVFFLASRAWLWRFLCDLDHPKRLGFTFFVGFSRLLVARNLPGDLEDLRLIKCRRSDETFGDFPTLMTLVDDNVAGNLRNNANFSRRSAVA